MPDHPSPRTLGLPHPLTNQARYGRIPLSKYGLTTAPVSLSEAPFQVASMTCKLWLAAQRSWSTPERELLIMADPFKKHRKERDEQAALGFYWCSRCKTYKPADEMTRSKRKYYGFGTYCLVCAKTKRDDPSKQEKKQTYMHQYYQEHKEELCANSRAWRKKNLDRLRAYDAERWKTPERKLQDKKYYESLPIEEKRRRARRWYTIYKERQVALNKAKYHTEEGKRKHRTWQLRYKHRKLNVISDFTSDQWEEALTYWNFKCAYCGKNPATDQDHFVPTVNGGGYTASNIVPACDHCNSSKRNLDVWDWAAYEGIPTERIETIQEWLRGRYESI